MSFVMKKSKSLHRMERILLSICMVLVFLASGSVETEAAANTRVYFYNSPQWSKVSAYVYGSSEALGGWPGTVASSDGDGWYYIDVPMNASEGFTIIFNDNNNGNQAGDIYINDTANVYLTAVSNNKYSSKDTALISLGGSAGDSQTKPDLDVGIELSGIGATLPYVEVEAEAAVTNGEILKKSIAYCSDIQAEASGRKAVKLDETGEYVEFTLQQTANTMVIRYAIPDGNNGAGIDSSLSMYINGRHKRDIEVTSKHAWVYGVYPFNNNPSSGNPHRFFDEVRLSLGQSYKAGTVIRLQKDVGDTAAYYVVDLVDFEQVDAPIQQPDGYLSVTDYGAVANDNQDDYNAFVNCIAQAKNSGKGVYIPEGTFHLNTERVINVSGVTVRGAGMWHTTLYGAGAAFKVSGTCGFSDFAMTGVSTIRDDSGDLAGFEGYDASSNVVIQNIWMEHMKVGCWFYNTRGLLVQGCRIRNTYADGINMCSNVHNSVIQNNHFRNTGDDSIAIWPWKADSNNNTIQYNTVQCPTLANCVAVYGGGNNKVLNNHLADTIAFGAGVNISTNFETPNGFVDEITVSDNILERCGSYEHDLNYPRGSIWLFAAMRPITAGVTISNNTVYDGSYSGVTFDGGFEINNVRFADNIFNATNEHAVHVRSTVLGSATFENHEVANVDADLIRKDSSRFTIGGEITQINLPLGRAGNYLETNADGERLVVLYQDADFAGNAVALEAGSYPLSALQNAGIKDNDITSLKVPLGYRVTLYANDNFGGAAKVVTADTDWKGTDFDNATTSVLIEKIQYHIINRSSGMVMDVAGVSVCNGVNVLQWAANEGENQLWTLTMLEDNSVVIKNVISGNALTVSAWSVENGGNIHVWEYGNQDNQKWLVTDLGDGYYSIINKFSNKAPDLEEASEPEAGNIFQWEYENQAEQQWKLEAVK